MARLRRAEIDAYLAEPHVAHLVTLRLDGTPHVAPVWFLRQENQVLVITGESSVKTANIQSSPLVSLSIATDQRPYQYVVLEGRAAIIRENLEETVRRICVKYDGPERGAAFAEELLAEGDNVVIAIEVIRIVSWKEDDG